MASNQISDVRVRLRVWSDYVCPFCYLEQPVLERLAREYGDRLRIAWMAYELRPEPVPTLDPNADYLRTVWDQAVYPMAADRGLVLHLPPVQPRSRRAHVAAAFARDQGRFDAMHVRLFQAFFADGRDLNDPAVLVDVGAAAGLNPDQLKTALDSGPYIEQVRRDQAAAVALGIDAVPTVLVDVPTAAGVSVPAPAVRVRGAQPYERVRAAVEQVGGNSLTL